MSSVRSRALLVGLGVAGLLGASVCSTAAAVTPGDTVQPVVDAITSTDFPPITSPATHHAAAPGQLTIAAHDDGSGLASVQWSLDDEMGVGGPPPSSRTSGSVLLHGAKSATVTVTVTPPSWGSHHLYVRAFDRAGLESWTVDYDFFVLTNPTPQVQGDLTGDGVPDLLVTNPAGDLRLLSALGAGRFGQAFLASSSVTALGVDWRTMPFVRMTTVLGDVDQILSHEPGSTVLDQWRNDGIGDLSDASIVLHPGCAPTTCPSDFPSDFSGLSSFVTASAGLETNQLVTIESGKAYLYPVGIRIGNGAPLELDGVDLARSDLVSPGDVDADGHADLWVRDRVTGVVTQFAGTDAGFAPTGTVVGTGFTATRWPVMVSIGDVTGDGVRDVVLGAPGRALQARPVTDLASVTRVLSADRLGRDVAVEGERLVP